MSNLVSTTRSSFQILDKTQMGIFPILKFLVTSFINKNCHNSKTKNDNDMKLGPVMKFDKNNTTTSQKN